jgi:hypothetical protein
MTRLRIKPGFEYSDRKIAVVTPTGITNVMQSTVRSIVPTMTGKIPPFVMASTGGWVINSQLKTWTPLYETKNNMTNRVKAPEKPRVLMSERKNPCLRLNFFLCTIEKGLWMLPVPWIIPSLRF